MTRDRDIERVLEAWLRPGPTVMPDRLFDGVLERIERQPQRRLVRIHRRITNMRPTSLMLVAAAIVVAVGAGVVLLGRPAASSVGTPTSAPSLAPSRPPAATAAASSSISAGEVPAALQYHWVSAPRLVAQASSKPVITVLTINFTTIAATINASSRPVLASTASATGPNSVSLTLVDALFGGCSVGDTGSYTWSEAPDGMTMTLVAANDACAARAAAFAGTWTKAGCPGTADPCLGQVPAGTYASTFFDLRSAAADVKAWGAYGQLRYTAPDGWANSDDSPAAYSLVPAPDFYGAVGEGQAFHGIYVNSRATAMATTASCSQSAPGVGHSANAIATWIAANPGLIATKATPITIDGLTGTSIDVRMAPGQTRVCAGDSSPSTPLLVFDSGVAGASSMAIGRGERMRVILLDVGPGQVLAIVIDDNSTPSRFDALVAQAMPVIATFQFPK